MIVDLLNNMALIGSKNFDEVSKEIFKLDSNIKYFALIDLEGQVIVENSNTPVSFVEADAERIMFYHQIGTRRSKREDFDDICGEVSYVHIQRKKNSAINCLFTFWNNLFDDRQQVKTK